MPLDPKRVQVVFLSALECHEPAARNALLDRECATDTELRRQVEALLTANDQPNCLLDQPSSGAGRQNGVSLTNPEDNGPGGTGTKPSIGAVEESSETIDRLPSPNTVRANDISPETTSRAVPEIEGYEILGEIGLWWYGDRLTALGRFY